MKMVDHNTGCSGHVVTIRWRHGSFQYSDLLEHDIWKHITKLHIEASRPNVLASYVEVHVPKGVQPSEMSSKLRQLLDDAVSRYDAVRSEISELLPSKVLRMVSEEIERKDREAKRKLNEPIVRQMRSTEPTYTGSGIDNCTCGRCKSCMGM